MKTVKRIAMIYKQVGTCGGIPRDAELLDASFKEWGYEPFILTEQDLGTGPERKAALAAILKKEHVDLVIEHDAYEEEKLLADISAARETGVKIVVFWHSVFSWMVASGRDDTKRISDILTRADAVIALSPTDEAYFRMIGCKALFIPTIDDDRMRHFIRQDHPHRIVWIGRFVGLKRPLDAVKTAEKVRETVPDAELEMLGDGDAPARRKINRYLSSRPALKAAVHLRGYVKDVDPYLKSAGIGLVTSKFEGYPHSIIEMKMASLPVVSYAMPYLVTLKDNSGAIQVPQGDVDAAASEIVKLFADKEECARQGKLARESYEEICSFDQRGAYERLFADLGKPNGESSLLSIDSSAARNVMAVFAEHVQMGFLTIKERLGELDAGKSRRGLVGLVGRLLMKVGRRLVRP